MSDNSIHDEDSKLFHAFVGDVDKFVSDKQEPIAIKKDIKINKNSIEFNNNSTQKGDFENDAFFAFHVSKKNRKEIRKGKVRSDATLDLHGYTVEQSKRLIHQFIRDCQQQEITTAIIVHGQGHHSKHGSVLKPAVQHTLSQHESIDAYCPAQPKDGGKGASYILVKKL